MQQMPVPTAYAGDRFESIAKAADAATAEELAERVEAMTISENPQLAKPINIDLTQPEAPAPPSGTGVPTARVSLSSSSSSSTSDIEELLYDPAAAAALTEAAKEALAAASTETAEEALAAAKRAATEQMEQID